MGRDYFPRVFAVHRSIQRRRTVDATLLSTQILDSFRQDNLHDIGSRGVEDLSAFWMPYSTKPLKRFQARPLKARATKWKPCMNARQSEPSSLP